MSNKYKVDWLEVARRHVFGGRRAPFKSVLKLDKNFHVYVHGKRENMSVEQDKIGTYLKIYFKTIK